MKKTVTKSTAPIEQYVVMSDLEWAQIILTGTTIQVYSTYGTYAYQFARPGTPFKKFLCNLNLDYFIRKTRMSDGWKVLDTAATVREWRKSVTRVRRTGKISKDDARELWDEIEEIQDSRPQKDADMLWMLGKTIRLEDYLSERFEEGFFEWKMDPTHEYFWKELWTPFVEQLRIELTEAA